MPYTIVVTGGHITPVLAVIDELQVSHPQVTIICLGRKFTSLEHQELSFEFQEMQKRNIELYHVETGRLARHSIFGACKGLMKTMQGIMRSYVLLKKMKPQVVFTCGGYIGFSVSVAAWLQNIPIHMHEQTMHPGIANRIIARIALRIFFTYSSTSAFFPQHKSMCTGNPVRRELLQKSTQIPERFVKLAHPLIFVTGGSLGSHSINSCIASLLPQLAKTYSVIVQTGNVKEFDDYAHMLNKVIALPEKLQKKIVVMRHILGSDMAWCMQHCDLCVSRAGANTVTELVALHKPAVLIPLPWSAHDEQLMHAQWFQKNGLGIVFEQEASSEKLRAAIDSVYVHLKSHIHQFSTLNETPFHPDAAARIAEALVA